MQIHPHSPVGHRLQGLSDLIFIAKMAFIHIYIAEIHRDRPE